MDAYETRAWEEIGRWKRPKRGRLSLAAARMLAPLHKATDKLADTAVMATASRAFSGIMTALNDATSWTVRADKIHDEFRARGYAIASIPDDIHKLELAAVDRVVGYLAAKYRALALGEGAATGVLGGPGIAADVPALLALSLRAIAEYATYYGYDVSRASERALVLEVLGASSAKSFAAKEVALAQIAEAIALVARKTAWRELEKTLMVSVIRRVGAQLGKNLVKGKALQVLPISGAVIGGGFNVWFISSVCTTAAMVYRERFLRDKYGLAAR